MRFATKTIILSALVFSSLYADEKKEHQIKVEIEINCRMSEELKDFFRSIPTQEGDSPNFEEWKSSFIHNMNQLILLVDSEKVSNTAWSVKTDDLLVEEMKNFP